MNSSIEYLVKREEHLSYELRRPAIARAYHLDYDEATRVTTAREGYFWKESEEKVSEGEPP